MDKDIFQDIHNRQHFGENTESLAQHLDAFCASDEITVFHEMLSLDFHVDVYLIDRKEDDFKILLTSGMSLLKMNVPGTVENPDEYAFAELMVLLPKKVKFASVYTGSKKNDWLISMLKQAARLPHHNNSWLGIGHTLQATHDLEPYAGDTTYAGCVVLPSVTFDESFTEFYSGDRKINIYSLFPLYANELEYKIEHGYNTFLQLLIDANTSEVINLARKNLLREK